MIGFHLSSLSSSTTTSSTTTTTSDSPSSASSNRPNKSSSSSSSSRAVSLRRLLHHHHHHHHHQQQQVCLVLFIVLLAVVTATATVTTVTSTRTFTFSDEQLELHFNNTNRARRHRHLRLLQQRQFQQQQQHHESSSQEDTIEESSSSSTSSSSSSTNSSSLFTTTSRRKLATSRPYKLHGANLRKYVTELFIPPVLFDDYGNKRSNFEIALRQFQQQMLPSGYPKTPIWGYGDPSKPSTFHHPSGTIEVTRYSTTYVTWRNELVVNATACRANGFGPSNAGCKYVPHVLQDKYGTPIVDTTLHWAAPDRLCETGPPRTDCEGPDTANPYYGPIPMVPHVHGAHTESRSDGYPESWFLPRANNIPLGYATEGTMFRSRFLPSQNVPDEGSQYVNDPSAGDRFFQPAADAARGKGYAVFRYTNDQDATALWYHDHALGLTRLNVYAGGAGFWLIRTSNNGENLLSLYDAKGKLQYLPGPPAKIGQSPNSNYQTRKLIREIPLAIQDKDFYNNGKLFFPANRVNFDYPDCHDGSTFGFVGNGVPYLPRPTSDLSPIWNPESFFTTMLVNGNTFPKLTVAPERYRLRLLNACDSRTLNLALKVGSRSSSSKELSFFVIGSDQGLLPQVVKLRTGYATKLTPGKPAPTQETPQRFPNGALLMGPSERYDAIVDFGGLTNGTVVYMINTAPDFPFGGFDGEDYEAADPNSSGQVMKFIVDYKLKKSAGDTSTSPYNLVLKGGSTSSPPSGSLVRDLSVFEYDSKICVLPPPSSSAPCNVPVVNCNRGTIDPLTGISTLTYGPIYANLGHGGKLGPGKLVSQKWIDPIHQNPALGTTEIWEFWNWTGDAHPLHIHLTTLKLLGRFDMKGNLIGGPKPYELGKKDTILALPGQVTRVQVTFDIAGYFVWHCHILSHEDNQMMVPFCVGRKGVDCPLSLF